MNVIRANVLGFCMGVRRAVKLAYAQADDSSERGYILGPLIHNPQVLEDLKTRGMETLDESRLPEDLHGASVVIRAHGISPQTEAKLCRRGAAITDATCPKVKASQLKAQALVESGYFLFLAGEKSHAEIAGILGYAEMGLRRKGDKLRENALPYVVVGNAAEASAMASQLAVEFHAKNTKVALIGQTTISEEEYMAISGKIATFFPYLEIARTICAATKERQDSLRELLDKVEALVIVGGKESSNTRRLFAIAASAGKPCVLAETENDIPPEFSNFETIGITAGASTPDTVIDAIERALGALCLPEQP